MLLVIGISIIALLSVNVINTSMNVVCSVSWLITVNIMIVIRVSERIQTALYYARYIMLPPLSVLQSHDHMLWFISN